MEITEEKQDDVAVFKLNGRLDSNTSPEFEQRIFDGIESGIYEIRLCEQCASYFDLNRTDGIFARPNELEGFICMPCAERMSAREFYEKYLG